MGAQLAHKIVYAAWVIKHHNVAHFVYDGVQAVLLSRPILNSPIDYPGFAADGSSLIIPCPFSGLS